MALMHKPDYHSHEEFQNRSKKLSEIRSLGVDPYPAKHGSIQKTESLNLKFEGETVGHSDDAGAGNTDTASVAGRIVLFRAMGKNAFAHLQDETGRIQVMFNRDQTKVEGFEPVEGLNHIKFIEKKCDLGDILYVEGNLFRTQRGELTIFAKKVSLLCKSLLPLPDKHSGLADKGVKYRKRWLDLITDPDSMNRFRLRSRIISRIRKTFEESGFEEVETPVLQNIYGGAQARPFTTHLNAHHQDMFLRISLEIPLKKLIVGGMQKIFEIGKVFRNEGIDRTHNPEFTMLEAYAAEWDYQDMMILVETLFESIALELFGSTQIRLQKGEGETEVIELKAPWKRISMVDSISEYAGLDPKKMTDEELKKALIQEAKVDPKEIQNLPRGLLIAKLFEELVEHHLVQPHHIIDHPIETTPLCKLHREEELRKQGIVERFESFILGREMCNSYTELNDPELQRELLESQAEQRDKGDEEASPLDEEFIEAICQGMPPTGGVGIGIDRLVMLFTAAESIRDVLFFPIMRPEE